AYQWFFNGSELASQTGAILNISPVTSSDAGMYHVRVTNPLFPDLTLYSEVIKVVVIQYGEVAAPTGLLAQESAGTVSLTWTDNAVDETAYRVEFSTNRSTWTTYSGVLPANTTSFTTE